MLKGFTGETIAFRWENLQVTETEYMTKDDSVSIFRNKIHTVYRLPSYHTLTTTNINKNGDIINEDSKTPLEFQYFVYHNKENYGHMYDSIDATYYRKRMLVDSFLVRHAFKNAQFVNLNNWKQLSIIREKDRFKKTYIPKDKSDTDTVYLSFSEKLKDLKYSFSSKLDSAKGAKLFQIKFVLNAIPPQTGGTVIPKKVYSFELKRAAIGNKDSIKKLIQVNNRLKLGRN